MYSLINQLKMTILCHNENGVEITIKNSNNKLVELRFTFCVWNHFIFIYQNVKQ